MWAFSPLENLELSPLSSFSTALPILEKILEKYKISSDGLAKNTLTILRINDKLEKTTRYANFVVADPPQKEDIMPPDSFS